MLPAFTLWNVRGLHVRWTREHAVEWVCFLHNGCARQQIVVSPIRGADLTSRQDVNCLSSEHLVVQLLVHYSLVHVPQILLKTKSIYYHVLNLLCACLHVSRLSAIFRTAQWGRTWCRSRATSLMATIPRRKPMEEQCTTLSNSPPTMAPEDHWCTISRYDTHSIQDTAVSLLPSLVVPSGSTPYL